MKHAFGVIGLGVMGRNIARNISRKGFSVTTFDFFDDVRAEQSGRLNDEGVDVAESLEQFISTLSVPRKILLLVKAGDVTEMTIDHVLPLLAEGDILIDGGNESYALTNERSERIESLGIKYIGMGVSGGEIGALNGPSLMPGGNPEAYENLRPIFEKIAAIADDGKPCVTYIGPGGSGHYVKMVHNGIEYADMELISEAYYFMKHCLLMTNDEMNKTFREWNTGELNSYLIEITANILAFKNEDGEYVIDLILDKAGQKGTGMLTGIEGLSLGIPLSLIADSVFMRCLSSLTDERKAISKMYNTDVAQIESREKEAMLESLRRALYFTKIMSYQQGFRLLKEASNEYGWNLSLGELAMIWREGCIIRAQFLEKINAAFTADSILLNLIEDDYFAEILKQYEGDVRTVAVTAVNQKVPMQLFLSAVSYFDGITKERVSANMIQAQRDYFGAHTYERIDLEGVHHTDWHGKDV